MTDVPDNREDWLIRWISMTSGQTTAEVLAQRRVIDPAETQATLLPTLKRLERQGWLSSRKDGRALNWTATTAGRKVMS